MLPVIGARNCTMKDTKVKLKLDGFTENLESPEDAAVGDRLGGPVKMAG